MATKINTTHKIARQDTIRVHPEDVIRGTNSRMIDAPDYANRVTERAISIFKQGQLQPAEARRNEENQLVLTLGFTRLDAIKLLREGFTAIDPDTGETFLFIVPDASLWLKVEDCTQEDAFARGLAENLERNDTTDLQEALAQSSLRCDYGWTDTKIARFYGLSNQNRVMALEKLLHLPEATQQLVHAGKLALHAALLTADLTDSERADLIDAATTGKGKVDGAALKGLIRDLNDAKDAAAGRKKADDDATVPLIPDGRDEAAGSLHDDDETSPPKPIKRTAKELQSLLAELDGRVDLTEQLTDFLGCLSLWMNGKRTNATLLNKLNIINGELS